MAVFDQLASEYFGMIRSSGVADDMVVGHLETEMHNMQHAYENLGDAEWWDIFSNGLTPLMNEIINETPSSVKDASDKTAAWNQIPISDRQACFNSWTQWGAYFLNGTLARYVPGSIGQFLQIDANEKYLVWAPRDEPVMHYILFIVPFAVPQTIDVYFGDTLLISKGGASLVTFKTAGKLMPADLSFRRSTDISSDYSVYYGDTPLYTGHVNDVTLQTSGKVCANDITLHTNFS